MLGMGLGLDMGIASSFTPLSLFLGGVGGVWYDPSDFSTLWQDSAGTVPVTAAGQTVLRVNDKSGNANAMTPVVATGGTIQQDAAGKWYIQMAGGCLRTAFGASISEPYTRATAIDQNVWAADRRIFSATTNLSSLLFQETASPRLTMYAGLSGPTSTVLAVGTKGILTETFNGASSELTVNNGTAATGNPGAAACGGFSLATSDAFPATFRFYGGVLRGAMTASEIAQTRTYLAAKAGVTL